MKNAMIFSIMVFVLVLGMGISVRASFEKERGMSTKQRQLLEEEYLQEVREILLEKGCKNAGVTLTYVTDAEGNRRYVVNVHHMKIRQMDSQEFSLLRGRIQEAADRRLMGKIALKQIESSGTSFGDGN